MKRFLVVLHRDSEFLGSVEAQTESRDIGFSYLRPSTGQELPASERKKPPVFMPNPVNRET